MRILSWNINGLRSSHKSGFLDWLYNDSPDILALQEVKAEADDLPDDLRAPRGYHAFFFAANVKKGYSGVGLYTKEKPLDVRYGLGIKKFDEEGRVLTARFEEFTLINAYFPNSSREGKLKYKLDFDDAFLNYVEELRKKGERIIFCGDMNVAHEDIDIARPKENEGNAGFTEEERAWIDEVVAHGYIDTFRHLYPAKRDAYSWWDLKSRARDRNVGWRIDYIFISPDLLRHLKGASILSHVMSSDHCPVAVELDFKK